MCTLFGIVWSQWLHGKHWKQEHNTVMLSLGVSDGEVVSCLLHSQSDLLHMCFLRCTLVVIVWSQQLHGKRWKHEYNTVMLSLSVSERKVDSCLLHSQSDLLHRHNRNHIALQYFSDKWNICKHKSLQLPNIYRNRKMCILYLVRCKKNQPLKKIIWHIMVVECYLLAYLCINITEYHPF